MTAGKDCPCIIQTVGRYGSNAVSMRLSNRDNALSVSSMTITRSQSAPACSNQGLMVSPKPSSAVWKMTATGPMVSLLSGSGFPVVTAAAIAKTAVVFLSPGSPCITVIFPNGI